MKKGRDILIVLSLAMLISVANGQTDRILGSYIDSALVNNIVLQQKDIAIEDAIYGLEIAKKLFYPTLDFEAQYVSSTGGRNIDLPIGDMLNPVYNTLNMLTQSQSFPQIDNERINFLPRNFYDAKFHIVVPIYNREMVYNRKIKEKQLDLTQYDTDSYKRELVKNVKIAYYTYLQAEEAIRIYESTLDLAKEGKRLNESLLENGKGLPAYVLRAESEVEKVKAMLIAAEQNVDNARAYFNFLLNRNLGAEIEKPGEEYDVNQKVIMRLSRNNNISQREELKSIDTAIDLMGSLVDIKKSELYPSLNAMVDLGAQAENWEFDSQSRYFMIGMQLNVPIFAWNRRKLEIERAKLSVIDAQLRKEHIHQQLELSSRVSENKLRSDYESYLAAGKQLDAANSYHRLIDRGYREGANSYIEMVDARNQLTESEIGLNINKFKLLSTLAELEREHATYDIGRN